MRAGLLALAALAGLAAPALAAPQPVEAAQEAYRRGDYAAAADLWRQACAAGNAQGCYDLAIVYRDGEGVAADPAKARELLEKACLGGVGQGCFNLGRAADPASPDDEPKATPSPEQVAAAMAWYKRGCDLGEFMSCANLAVYHRDGRGTAKDVDRAVALLDGACRNDRIGAGPACFSLSAIFDEHESAVQRPDPEAANAALQRGCGLGDANSCFNLGYHYRSGYGVAQNFKRMRALYAQACEDANSWACPQLAPNEYFGGGSAYRKGNVHADKRQAAGLYQDACDDGLAQGCASLANLVMKGGKAVQSEAQVRALLARALELDRGNFLAGLLQKIVDEGGLAERDARHRLD